jgi:hypothetical protein
MCDKDEYYSPLILVISDFVSVIWLWFLDKSTVEKHVSYKMTIKSNAK